MKQNHLETPDYQPIEALQTRKVQVSAIGDWLTKGWGVFTTYPKLSLLYGAIFVFTGFFILAVSSSSPLLTFSFWTGFLLVGPILAVNVNRVAQFYDEGKEVSIYAVLKSLQPHAGRIAIMTLMLAIIMIGWIRFSTLIVAIISEGNIPTFESLADLLFSASGFNLLFGIVACGALFASVVYLTTVITMPIVLDNKAGFIPAVLTSISVVVKQPLVMLLWAFEIALLTFVGSLFFFIGLAIVFPWLGYATWYCYKDLVE